MQHKSLKSLGAIAAIIGAVFAIQPAHAGGGGFAGATEPTQIMNNIELVASYGEQVQSKVTQLNQYMTMLDNLQQLPADLIGKIANEFGTTNIANLQRMAASLGKVQNSAMSVMNMYSNAQNTVARLQMEQSRFANMTVSDYARYIAMMSQTKKGAYKEQYDQSVSKLKQLEDDARDNQQLISETNGINGNVQGLQQLSRTQGAVISVMQKQRADLLEMRAQENLDKLHEAQRREIMEESLAESNKKSLNFLTIPTKIKYK